jgi:hypothetical protein
MRRSPSDLAPPGPLETFSSISASSRSPLPNSLAAISPRQANTRPRLPQDPSCQLCTPSRSGLPLQQPGDLPWPAMPSCAALTRRCGVLLALLADLFGFRCAAGDPLAPAALFSRIFPVSRSSHALELFQVRLWR